MCTMNPQVLAHRQSDAWRRLRRIAGRRSGADGRSTSFETSEDIELVLNADIYIYIYISHTHIYIYIYIYLYITYILIL